MTDFKRGDLVEVVDLEVIRKGTNDSEFDSIFKCNNLIVSHAPKEMLVMVIQTSIGTRIWVDKAWFKKVIND